MKIPLLFKLTFVFLLLSCAFPAKADTWYLYNWDSTNSTSHFNQAFSATDDANIFIITGFEITLTSGFNFSVRNDDWGKQFGWNTSSVTTTGTTVALASSTGATGWCSLGAGTYDITFDYTNTTNPTIQFDLSGSSSGGSSGDTSSDITVSGPWYLMLYNQTTSSATYPETETAVALTATGNANEYSIEFTMPELDTTKNGFALKVFNTDWAYQFGGWSEDIENLGTEYKLTGSSSSPGDAWLANTNITAGKKYVATFKIISDTEATIKFTLASGQYVSSVTSGTIDNITYNFYPDGHALYVSSTDAYLRGGDISYLNYLEDKGVVFRDANGNQQDLLQIFKDNGVNIVRLRLYNNPGTKVTYKDATQDNATCKYHVPAGYLDEADVLDLAKRAKQYGMQIELTFHYSDYWTNGDRQIIPTGWSTTSLESLKTSVYNYTKAFLEKMAAQGTSPEYISIGNEVQAGLLFGYTTKGSDGYYSASTSLGTYWKGDATLSNIAALLSQGCSAARAVCPNAKIIIHGALTESNTNTLAQYFFGSSYIKAVDYDLIGLSYYPTYTNYKPEALATNAQTIYNNTSKPIIIMEVGYSWTPYLSADRYGYSNIEGQLKFNGSAYGSSYCTTAYQKSFMQDLQTVIKNNSFLTGYIYWDPIYVDQKVNGSWADIAWAISDDSSQETPRNLVANTTWFDYNTGNALEVFDAIKADAVIVPETVTYNGVQYIVEYVAPYELTTNDLGYATFYDDEAYLIPSDLTVSVASAVSNGKMVLTYLTSENIPATTAVIAKGAASTTYYLWVRYDKETAYSGSNVLIGTLTSQSVANVLTLGDSTNGDPGFYAPSASTSIKAYATATVNANTAYYVSTTETSVLFDISTTGVEDVLINQDIEEDNTIYDLNGRIVLYPQRGQIYIINHRKVLFR